jgi:hypothetical protein
MFQILSKLDVDFILVFENQGQVRRQVFCDFRIHSLLYRLLLPAFLCNSLPTLGTGFGLSYWRFTRSRSTANSDARAS